MTQTTEFAGESCEYEDTTAGAHVFDNGIADYDDATAQSDREAVGSEFRNNTRHRVRSAGALAGA